MLIRLKSGQVIDGEIIGDVCLDVGVTNIRIEANKIDSFGPEFHAFEWMLGMLLGFLLGVALAL